jgi:hypothetical protein
VTTRWMDGLIEQKRTLSSFFLFGWRNSSAPRLAYYILLISSFTLYSIHFASSFSSWFGTKIGISCHFRVLSRTCGYNDCHTFGHCQFLPAGILLYHLVGQGNGAGLLRFHNDIGSGMGVRF